MLYVSSIVIVVLVALLLIVNSSITYQCVAGWLAGNHVVYYHSKRYGSLPTYTYTMINSTIAIQQILHDGRHQFAKIRLTPDPNNDNQGFNIVPLPPLIIVEEAV